MYLVYNNFTGSARTNGIGHKLAKLIKSLMNYIFLQHYIEYTTSRSVASIVEIDAVASVHKLKGQ